ncbi:MAG: hypothetical protein WEC59_07310 [Salibacteraceae bacterium]
MKTTTLFLILAFLFFTETIHAQMFKEFSGVSTFLEELDEEMVNKAIGDAKKENKKLIEKFTEMWVELNAFTPEEQRRMVTTCNSMLDQRLKVIPDVRDYISTVMTIIEVDETGEKFTEWHKVVDVVLSSRSARREFGDFLTFSSKLYGESTIFHSASTDWITDNTNYRFEIEDGNPKLIVPGLNLKCLSKQSEIEIKKTSGIYYPLDGKWIGKGGTVTWERAGLDPNKVYAIINDYEILMKFSKYNADSVTFYNTDYFDAPLQGRLEDAVRANVTEDNASFPVFKSYSKRIKIANIDPGVDYEGGFTQRGSRFIASGDTDDPAYLVFYLDDKPFLELSSVSFSILESKISSTDARVKFMLHEDSITHPGLDFKYFRDSRTVNLFKSNEGLQKAPYFDSYHAIDIYTELVQWKIDQPKIIFTTIPNSSDNRAFFESDYYFREDRFDKQMGIGMSHPMVDLKRCFDSRGTNTIWDEDFARCLNSSITDAQVILLNYTNMGFVDYNPETHRVRAKERLFHYVAAKSEQEDYDVIQVASDIGTMENASMDLIDEVFTLDINGIRNITLSDSHQVVLFPKGGNITMGKNRDFNFSGVVKAGRLEFFGNNFEFEYDAFKIEMPNVDSLRLIVGTGEKTATGKERLARVSTVIEDLNGTLEIDNPKNKSGLEQLEQFPIFTSHENSFVFYDRSNIQNKSYLRENFYFELDPFVFDSLDNFGNERVNFDGNFVSADIFPEFRETLTVQEDYSLGFIRTTPTDGFDVYRGKGTYNDTIKMSHEGLRGSGKLKYLGSTTKSTDFLFLPEEMRTVANSFVLEESMGEAEYPPATGKNIKQIWTPYDDNLHLETTDNPFLMYDGSELTGSLNLNPEGLEGAGLFVFERAELESEHFEFGFSGFHSDTADFRLKSDVSAFEGFQFKTNNVSADIDFTKRKGDFISNDGTSMMEFPQNQYVAFMDRFTWYMDQEAIELSGGKADKNTSAGAMQFEGSRFISMHPDQDSLEFYSPAARYDLKNSIIDAKEIKYIQVADALIYPDSGLITILKKAKMKPLTDCKITANAITKYHTIDSATVDIFARKDYFATGLYTYKDIAGGRQQIRFSTIGVDSAYQTYAKGNIDSTRGFTLSPQFEFRGEVNLTASEKELTFDGYSKIRHECTSSIAISWFKFKAPVDPDEIYLPVEKTMLDQDEEILTTSIVLNPDTGAIYSSFLSKKQKKDHYDLLPADGYINYRSETAEYRISNIRKLTQFSLPGQYMSLDADDCKVYSDGKLGFGINPGQLDLTTIGNINHDLTNNEVKLDVLLLLDFFFDDKLIDDMGKTMAENALGDPVNFERDTYQKGLRELIGTDEADQLISTILLTGNFKKFPSELEKKFFLTDLQLEWNPETDSYQSTGTIGVGTIGKRQVNVKVNGKVEVVVGRIPEINIYLEADNSTWWYFKYSRNIMQAYSSLEDFNSSIGDLKADKRKLKVDKGEAPYSFMLSSKRRKDDFLSKF